jgi:hypothetical protein
VAVCNNLDDSRIIYKKMASKIRVKVTSSREIRIADDSPPTSPTMVGTPVTITIMRAINIKEVDAGTS